MGLPRPPEDERQAGGWRSDFDGHSVREIMVVKSVRPYTIWKKPALLVRMYEGGIVTLAEIEWSDEWPMK